MLTENARAVLERRYLIKDEDGNPAETPEQLFSRVALAVARAEALHGADERQITERAREFAAAMESLEFLPNSPTLMNAGRPLGQLSACFVLPVPDSMDGIFEAIKQAALIHKSGGGTGFSFSRLRQAGAVVGSTGGVASGPVSFMKVFNTATEAVKQGGTRRGANMGVLRVDHPDILAFIACKADGAEITNFNISVGITDEFMRALSCGGDYTLKNPRDGSAAGTLPAREVWDAIVHAAWSNGEPGVIFIDRMNAGNVTPSLGDIEATNPCGEQPLLPYESCNLGSVNLALMTRDGEVDYDRLGRVVDTAVRFLDDVIDVNQYPLEEIGRVTRQTRKIGLGVMGFADMLMSLRVPYACARGVELADEVMGFINERARLCSAQLARERGAFPLFAESTLAHGEPMRNATVTTIAPTGTLSIIAGCGGGIEPVFSHVFRRNVMDGTELIEVNPLLERELRERGLYSDALREQIAERGSLRGIAGIPADMLEIYQCAHDIAPQDHIRMQAAFQRHVDNAVSKTVNFPAQATPEEVEGVYALAYELRCKGVTIYRDGSRANQVLTAGSKRAAQTGADGGLLHPRARPDITRGFTEKVRTGCGNLYVTVNYDDNGICEVFTNTGRYGGCPSQSEATSRLVSIALRSGLDPRSIIEQLRGIRCTSTIRQPGMKVTSCPDAIAKVIAKVLSYKNGDDDSQDQGGEQSPQAGGRACPECGQPLEHGGGCVLCPACGYSKCN